MERADRAPVATFYVPGAWTARVELDDGAAHHAQVKRLVQGDRIRLSNGAGRRVVGTLDVMTKRRLDVAIAVDDIEHVAPLPVIELWAPVADRERMLTLAEKAVELSASVWRPVVYRRSRSVTPRGDGAAFAEKTRLRMVNALEQCGAAWLPRQLPESDVVSALDSTDGGILLDGQGDPFADVHSVTSSPPLRIALGPEGGIEPDERASFERAGWRLARLGDNVLRFETAGIAALAVARTLLMR